MQIETEKYNARVWAGDPTTVVEARERFGQDPDGQLIPFATALYSARKDKKFGVELIELRGRLTARGRATLTELIPDDVRKRQELATRIDVLSTYLEWIARKMQILTPDKPQNFVLIAREVTLHLSSRGIRLYDELKPDHTLLLLYLTKARIFLSDGHRSAAIAQTKLAAQGAIMFGPSLDRNQRVRVYAKIGMLYRMLGKRNKSIRWGFRALLVGSVPLNVRMKALAALLGFDR